MAAKTADELRQAAFDKMAQAAILVGNPFGSDDRQRDFQAAMDAVAEYAAAADISVPESHAVLWDRALWGDAADGWHLIDEPVPEHEDPVLIYRPDLECDPDYPGHSVFVSNRAYVVCGNAKLSDATHWHTLPKPPAQVAESGDGSPSRVTEELKAAYRDWASHPNRPRFV